MLTERARRFAEAYARSGNATQSAIKAGYSKKRAHVTGSELVADRRIQELINSKLIKREVHAETTYQNLITLSEVAMEEVKNARDTKDFERLSHAIDSARRTLETVGKSEGLFVQKIEHSGEIKGQEVSVTVNVNAEEIEARLQRRLAVLHRGGPLAPGGNGRN